MKRDDLIRHYLDVHIPRLVKNTCTKHGLEGPKPREVLLDRLTMSLAIGLARGEDRTQITRRLVRIAASSFSARGSLYLAREEHFSTLTENEIDQNELEYHGPSVEATVEARDILSRAFGGLDEKAKELVDSRYGITSKQFAVTATVQDIGKIHGCKHQWVSHTVESKYHDRVRRIALQASWVASS